MSILENIKATKHTEVELAKERVPVAVLQESRYYESPCLSLKDYLHRDDKTGIIAEIKRKSPSKGLFKRDISVEMLSIGYMQNGAAALSVLTDQQYFGGSQSDLETARRYNLCPILRKDFMIDLYQVEEAKAWGADAILLIAKMIDEQLCKQLAEKAHELGMETVLEVHEKDEIKSHYHEHIDIIGVNNRDLDDFSTDWKRSVAMKDSMPENITCISESGISSPETIKELKACGYSGFLIGEAFMTQGQPEVACGKLVSALKQGQ